MKWLFVVALCACRGTGSDHTYPLATGGDRVAGEREIVAHGCDACHEIPGIRGLHGRVAVSLDDFAHRGTIAGVVPNTPDNLVRWLRDPPRVVPHTAMPATGLTDKEARDVAAYLYTLD